MSTKSMVPDVMVMSYKKELKDGREPKCVVGFSDEKSDFVVKLPYGIAKSLYEALGNYIAEMDNLLAVDGYRIVE